MGIILIIESNNRSDTNALTIGIFISYHISVTNNLDIARIKLIANLRPKEKYTEYTMVHPLDAEPGESNDRLRA